MSRSVPAGAAQLWAIVTLVGADGAKALGVEAADVSVSLQVEGAAPVGPLVLVDSVNPAWAENRFYEIGGGDYRVGLPLALAAASEIGDVIRVFGTYAGGDLHSETLVIVAKPSNSGTGSRIVSLTVQDEDGEPVEGIAVSAFLGVVDAGTSEPSDDAGETEMHLNLATYRPSAGLAGVWRMADPDQSFTVTADGPNEFVIELEFMAIPPSGEAGVVIGRIDCYDETIVIEPGAKVSLKMKSGPGEAGRAINSRLYTQIVNDDGDPLDFRVLIGATYYVLVGDETPDPDFTFTAPSSNFLIRERVGRTKP